MCGRLHPRCVGVVVSYRYALFFIIFTGLQDVPWFIEGHAPTEHKP